MPSEYLLKEAKEYCKVDDVKAMLGIIEDNKKVLLSRDKEGIEAINEAYKSIVGMASCMEQLIEAVEQERQEGWKEEDDHGVTFELGRQEAEKEYRQKLYTNCGNAVLKDLIKHYKPEALIAKIKELSSPLPNPPIEEK